MKQARSKIGWKIAATLVIANMIGTGVFTSLGFQLIDIQNTWSIVLLWCLGGIVALMGAFCYAEIGSAFPSTGGEFIFLSRLYHPLVGYLAGWISLLVGFAAPVALSAMALGAYLSNVFDISPVFSALGAIVLLSAVHSRDLVVSSRFQALATWAKVFLIAGLILLGVVLESEAGSLDFSRGWDEEVFSPSFAIAFVFVTYSYTGWNAAAYIIEEVERPAINLPKALVRGTFLVMILYVGLQLVFLKHGALSELQGQIDVGHVFAQTLFGNRGTDLIDLLIVFFLISSISAMVWIGPRVSMAMGRRYALWGFLRRNNRHGIPVSAIWLQAAISAGYVLTGTFESVLLYCGFMLNISALLTVAGVLILRERQQVKSRFRSPFYPLLPILFVLISLWILCYLILQQPLESLVGAAVLGVGAITYAISPQNRLP